MSKKKPVSEMSESDDDEEPPLKVFIGELVSSEDDSPGPETPVDSLEVSQSMCIGSSVSTNTSSSLEVGDAATIEAKTQEAGVDQAAVDDISKSDDDRVSSMKVSRREQVSSEEVSPTPESSVESPEASPCVFVGSSGSRNTSSPMDGENTTAALVKTQDVQADQTAGIADGPIPPKGERSNVLRFVGGITKQTQEEENHAHFTVETGPAHFTDLPISTDRSHVQVHGNVDQALARSGDTCRHPTEVHYHLHQSVTNAIIEKPSAVVIGNNAVVNQGIDQETETVENKPPSKVKILRDTTLATIQEWTEGMVHTRAVTTLVDKLSAAPPVFVIKGQPGEGKTTVAMMALKRLYDMGRNVFIIKTPEEYMTVKPVKESVILLNDVFGSTHFHESNLMPWDKVLDEHLALEEHTGKAQTSKSTILLVSRSSVLDSASEHFDRFHSLILRENGVMDLTQDIAYTADEKMQIWSSHAQRAKVEVDERYVRRVCHLHLIHGFPHCCKIFAEMYSKNSNLDIVIFFTRPLEFLKQKIKSMFAQNIPGQLLRNMLQNGGEYSGDLSNTSEHSYQIKQIIANGKGIYFRQEETRVTFHHPSIYDAVAYIACEKDPLFVIDWCSMTFLNDRVRLQGLSGFHKEEQTTVSIDSRFRTDLLKRMKAEIAVGNIYDVLSHHAFHDWDFANQFMEELLSRKSDSESVRRLIEQKDKLTMKSFLVLSPKSKSSNILQYICERVTLPHEEQKELLFSICKNRSTASMHYFLKQYPQCDLSVEGDNGESLLIAAANSRCGEMVILLMSKGVNVQHRDRSGCTALYYVCVNGVENAATVVDMMLKNEADVFEICKYNTHLVLACFHGNSSVVEALLQNETMANVLDKQGRVSGYSALGIAALRGFEQIVRILLDKGAQINECGWNGRTPLQNACIGGSDVVVKTLLMKGAEVQKCDAGGRAPLHCACLSGSDTIVKTLLSQGAEIHKCDASGRTPLHEACLGGSDTIVKTLLSQGAEIHKCDASGRTPLHEACLGGSDAVVKTLLSKGAGIHKCDASGRTPLHEACLGGSDAVVKTLLSKGAGIHKCDASGRTPLHEACLGGSDDVVKTLLSKGAEINKCDSSGRTPLHETCLSGFETVVKTLLSKGAEINKCDQSGMTPLDVARVYGFKSTITILLGRGAECGTSNQPGVSRNVDVE